MKKVIGINILIIFMMLLLNIPLIAQTITVEDSVARENAILKDFIPFSTPRTSGRPGSVFRISASGKRFFVEDIKQIKSYISKDGNIKGIMYFTPSEILEILNLNFNDNDVIKCEVGIKNVIREYTDQANVDKVLWDDDKAEDIVVDEKSKYYLIRETISTKEITYSFSSETIARLIRGKDQLTNLEAQGNGQVDFPYQIKKKFKTPHRIFYLDQKIGEKAYEN